MPEAGELLAVITALSALIGSVSTGLVHWGLRAAARRKAMAEAAGVEAGVSSTLFAEWKKIVEELREEVKRLTAARLDLEHRLEEGETRERDLEAQLRQARRDIETLKATVRALKQRSPQPGD